MIFPDFEKSFASSEKAKYWSIKNTMGPINVFKNSHKKFWFDCNNCNHSFESSLSSITNGCNWCPYCSNPPKNLCVNETCKTCFEKSFGSSEKAKYWSITNEKNPRDVFKSSNKKFWFECDTCCSSFYSSLNNITNSGSWCPKCVNKTELKLLEYLIELYPEVIHQVKFNWCMHTTFLPFDFYIPSKNLIIELDGRQHFVQVSNWDSPFKTQIKDAHKTRMARRNGINVIRILQQDVWSDTIDWKNLLTEVLET
jgi:very-short-patch-repair endonuclease